LYQEVNTTRIFHTDRTYGLAPRAEIQRRSPREGFASEPTPCAAIVFRGHNEETAMRTNTIALATAFALSSTLAFAQAGGNTAGGSSAAGGPAASQTTTGDSKDGSTTSGGGNATKEGAAGATTGSSTPSAKDASTQGAGTAGSVEKKGDATTPGGTMKK
jgi:hypothetical protein